MNTGQVHCERRAAQRFDFHLPVTVGLADTRQEGSGFTQDLSARGAFFYTDLELPAGACVELTLVMPSEITLAENMRVRCRGKVVRVGRPSVGTKCGVAVHLEGYEFLQEDEADTETSGSFDRISALHDHAHLARTES
jgi:hypothetical protein